MSASKLRRQWVPVKGGSADLRIGYGATDEASAILSQATGKPKRCCIVLYEDTDADLAEELRRQVVDAGYAATFVTIDRTAWKVRTLEVAQLIMDAFLEAGITCDDLCCVLGDADLISVASFVADFWCAGTSVCAFPTDEIALLEGALAPRALDYKGARGVIQVAPTAKRVIVDTAFAQSPIESETSAYLRSLMVAAAMCASEREFSALWDRSDDLMAGDEKAYMTQLTACAKGRGQTMGSTAAAVRQAIDYGRLFADVVGALAPEEVAPSVLMAEGLRFSARISVAMEKLSIDDMLAQDELLEALGIGVATCTIEPEALVAGLKEERFRQSNRFMLLIPLAIGRVRLTAVEDDLLLEHARAWCAAHRP